MHVRPFVDRFFLVGLLEDDDEGLYRQMWVLYPDMVEIATEIKGYTDKEYQTKIPVNEIVFLSVHVNRLMNHSAIDS